MTPALHIGTAGWSIPRACADAFPTAASALARYAARFDAAEINTSFYRPHRPSTYARWAETTPDGFRFSAKLPRAVTHDARLIGTEPLLDGFLAEVGALGPKLGPLIVQLPPSLAFDTAVAETFFTALRERHPGQLACEPRHPSWFEAEAQARLATHRIARVAADPPPAPCAAEPGGWPGLVYLRLHGAPRMYYSGYDDDALQALAERLRARAVETWVMFDNTASGRAAQDALALQALSP